jgi:hypothetical protein
MANQQWQHSEFSVNGEQQAVAFLNLPLRQGAGEASVTLRNDGSAGLIWLEPGSLGDGTQQTWQPREFPAPNGAQEAANFLNEPLRQGRGEASANLRNDGSAGLVWLEPGSLGTSGAQAWEVREFSGQTLSSRPSTSSTCRHDRGGVRPASRRAVMERSD